MFAVVLDCFVPSSVVLFSGMAVDRNAKLKYHDYI